MNWEAVAAIAELIGSAAVLATLIYLTVQVTQSKKLLEENRKIAMSQVYATRVGFMLNYHQFAADSTYIAPLIAEDMGISEDEFRRRRYHTLHPLTLDNILYQYELGLIEEEFYNAATNNILLQWEVWENNGVRVSPSVRKWYEENKNR